AEDRVAARRGLIHVSVEMIARELRKALDVRHGHFSFRGIETVADGERTEGNAERVSAGVALATALDPAARDRRQHIGRPLNRSALHVVQDAADATHLLSAARATRSAMDQMGERRAVARRLLGAMAVDDEEAPVKWSQPEHQTCRHRLIAREHRADETSRPAPGKRDGGI